MAETHVLSALVKKRSEIAGEIEHFEKLLHEYCDSLISLDKTIHIFDPDYHIKSIKNKKVTKKGYFNNGEATKLILDVLRVANKPVKTTEIIDMLAERKSLIFKDNKERYAFSKNVSVALNNICKKGLIEQVAKEKGTAVWKIAEVI